MHCHLKPPNPHHHPQGGTHNPYFLKIEAKNGQEEGMPRKL